MSKALIDGDIIAYSVGFACDTVHYVDDVTKNSTTSKKEADEFFSTYTVEVESEPIENCLHSVKLMIEGIMEKTGSDEHSIYLTGEGNYRADAYKAYKEHRKDKRKPTHLEKIKEYLINVHGAEVVDGMEADDKLGIEQCKDIDNTIICTIDKDLDMIPGRHYNWRKEELYEMRDPECLRVFFRQCLKGDSVDNIPGLYKTTGKKATKSKMEVLDTLDTFDEMWEYVDEQYEYNVMFPTIAMLLWIKRKEAPSKIEDLANGKDSSL